MIEITLRGSSNVEQKLQILSTLYRQAEEKVNHVDESRQRNMNYALVIFAALLGVGVGINDAVTQAYISITVFIVMCIFCLWDRRLHKLSHGWRTSSSAFCTAISEVINHPDQDITVPSYRADGEKRAEAFAFQPMIFYSLVLGALISFLIFFFK